MTLELHTSKIAFLFISFVIIASGYVTQVLPCQTQSFIENSIVAKHIVGILISFLFIMLEGGWSFDEDTQDAAQVDWSNGNARDSLIFGVLLYTVFLLSAKMQLVPNIILYTSLFCIYVINTQRLYWKNRDIISEKTNEEYITYTKYGLFFSLCVFIYGVIDYYNYQKKSYGGDFSFQKFILGKTVCSGVKKV